MIAEIAAWQARGETTEIKVYEPCVCASCAAGRRWFYCERPIMVARYGCMGLIDAPSIPHPDAVAYVRGQHPEKVLVYVDLRD